MNRKNIILPAALLVAAFAAAPARAFDVKAVMFDFDNAKPALNEGTMLPVVQSVGGVRAYFDFTVPKIMSIESAATKPYKVPAYILSGEYLWADSIVKGQLEIRFSEPVTMIALNFATLDFRPDTKVPCDVVLRAFNGPVDGKPIVTVMGHGFYGDGSLPVGSMLVEAEGMPFSAVTVNVVRDLKDGRDMPTEPMPPMGLLVDDVTVVTSKCALDMDCNGTVDAFDIFMFLNYWFERDLRADYFGNGVLDIQDIYGFMGAWLKGAC